MEYDYLIVGSGFFGSICANELKNAGKKVLVIEKRNHIGGNCYTENRDGINLHMYGPHVFHTSNRKVWDWITKFSDFYNFKLETLANYKGELFSLPFNMWTFSKMWNIVSPSEARSIIEKQSSHINEPRNLEEQAIKLVGIDVYEKLIKGYTEKQWKKNPSELPKEIIKRLPVRFTYNSNYFNDDFQGIPKEGYTKIFQRLLDKIEVKLNVDYLKNKDYWNSISSKIIYTGAIDAYYEYKFGELEYKTTKFIHERKNTENYQGAPVINYTELEIPYTRIIEHKHFENSISNCTWITYEYPENYTRNKEPYYPVNDLVNTEKYKNYKMLAEKEEKVMFGGRLAEYRYYDMHQVIESALNFIQNEISKTRIH